MFVLYKLKCTITSPEYFLSNDQDKQDRQTILNEIVYHSFGEKLYLTPLPEEIHECIYLGTDNGEWAIQFSDKHPQALITGTDLNPIQPSAVRPNVSFMVDDFKQP